MEKEVMSKGTNLEKWPGSEGLTPIHYLLYSRASLIDKDHLTPKKSLLGVRLLFVTSRDISPTMRYVISV